MALLSTFLPKILSPSLSQSGHDYRVRRSELNKFLEEHNMIGEDN